VVIAHKHTPFAKAVVNTRCKKKESGSGYQTQIDELLRADKEAQCSPEVFLSIREKLIPVAACMKHLLQSIISP